MLFLRRNVYLHASQQVDDFSRKEYHIGEFIEDGFMIWFKTVTTRWSKQNIIIIIIVIYVWGKRYVLRGLSGISIDDSIITSLHEVMHLKQPPGIELVQAVEYTSGVLCYNERFMNRYLQHEVKVQHWISNILCYHGVALFFFISLLFCNFH